MGLLENDNKAFQQELANIIEHGKQQVALQVNSTVTWVYWQVGNRINNYVLDNKRAIYGK